VHSRYNTAKSAASEAGAKFDRADKKRIAKTTNAFWAGRAVRKGGTVGIPVYPPGSPFPDLVHVSVADPHDARAGLDRSMRSTLGGSASRFLKKLNRPQTAA